MSAYGQMQVDDGTRNGDGNCFPVALALLTNADELLRAVQGAAWRGATTHVYLAHGLPVGTGGDVEGERYWHAWLEVGSLDNPDAIVFDWSNGNRHTLRRDDFYRIGQLDPARVRRYTRRQARYWAIHTGIAGPWEEAL